LAARCREADAKSCQALGEYYADAKKGKEASELYNRACDLGIKEACMVARVMGG
jgi:TPR repeat protein